MNASQPDYRRRTKILVRTAILAVPVGLLAGIGIGSGVGVPAIGAAIGAGLGFGIAVVTFAAAVVTRAADPSL